MTQSPNPVRRIGALLQGLLLAVLVVAAVIYFALPLRAQERPSWLAELWAMEEGEMLVAAVTSIEPVDGVLVPTLVVTCGLRLRYDPGPIDESIDWTGQTATFEFDFGDASIERELQYEALDGLFATGIEAADPLLAAIEAGSEVTVLMPSGGIPENTFSLKGSSAAIAEVRRACR